VQGRAALSDFDRGGLEPLNSTPQTLRARLTAENRTLKRAMTDPRFVSGVGNAYSDEILHRAGLSPVSRTQSLSEEAWRSLHDAMVSVLTEWRTRLRHEVGDGFPEKVTAFHDEMAVHGKYGKPCPVCATAVQRIRYAANELNYCPRCQTGGKLLADRSLSRLLKGDWPKTIEELENLRSG
jgi:formamidopyrimidine-DNA glycosylase